MGWFGAWLGCTIDAKSISYNIWECVMRSGKTSSSIARKSSAILKDGRASVATKSAAGSALTQSRTTKKTSATAARAAAKVLASPRSPKSAKSVAASVLSQKKEPFPVKTYRVAGSTLTQRTSADAVRKAIKKSK